MKTKYLVFSILFSCISMIVVAQTKADTVKVWGNCATCKGKIEKAAIAAGASVAEWNEETKLLVVSYDASKTSKLDIQKKIASAGYDTQDAKASDAAYKKLEKCCQYKRPEASKDTTGMKDMHGMNNMNSMHCMTAMNMQHMNCSKEDCCNNNNNCCSTSPCCNTSAKDDCAKTGFGKGYYYIGSSCANKQRINAGVVISNNVNINCCKM